MYKKTIFETETYRIIESLDEFWDMEDLKGDIFNPKYNPEIDKDKLKEQESDFERKVSKLGVFGYILEKKCVTCGHFEHVDSCWGFIGNHDIENHYIVDEFKSRIETNEILF